MTFEISSSTTIDPHKTKCGDYSDFLDIEAAKLLILVLADGVGSSVCDWKAAKTTCTEFIRIFKDNPENEDISKRIIHAIKETNHIVTAETGACAGMKSTFVGVVWDYENGIIYYISIGDSRIYLVEKETIKQITKDETATIIRKGMDGKPLIYAGVAVVAEGITNAVGALVSCVVSQIEDKNTEGVLLASDGFYNCQSSFETDVRGVFNDANMTVSLKKIARQYKDFQKDDMTVILARKHTRSIYQAKDITNQVLNGNDKGFSRYEIVQALFEQLSKNIDSKKSADCQQILSYCEKHTIQFEQNAVNDLIRRMFALDFQDGITYRYLVNMLRKSQI